MKKIFIFLLILLMVRILFATIVDFTTYTEVDEGGDITVAENSITISTIDCLNENSYVYKDMGADYFDGDFTHYVSFGTDNPNTSTWFSVWMVANGVGNRYALREADVDYISIYHHNLRLTLVECNGGVETDDDSDQRIGSVTWYLTLRRDEAVGANGTIYCDIHLDASRETLIETLSVTLSEKQDFRYVYGFATFDASTPGVDWSGSIFDLDLNPPSGSTAKNVIVIFDD